MTEEQERRAFVEYLIDGKLNESASAEHVMNEVIAYNPSAYNAWMARASLAKPQPVGGALTALIDAAIVWTYCPSAGSYTEGRSVEDCCEELAAAVVAYTGYQHDDDWWSEEEMRARLATLSAPVAQPGEAVSEPEPRCDMCHFKHGHRTGCPNNLAADLCTPKMLHPSHISGEWVDANGQYYALATPIAAQPAAAEPAKCTAADGKTPIHNIPGHPLMVRAVDFNAAISAPAKLAPCFKVRVRGSTEELAVVGVYDASEGGDCIVYVAAPAQAAAVPEAVERDALIDVARTALEAYENRFESVYGRYNGPIDDEMKALKAAIVRAALSQGDVSGEGEGW